MKKIWKLAAALIVALCLANVLWVKLQSSNTAWAIPNNPAKEKAKVIISTIAPNDDIVRVIAPAKVEAKLQSLVTADIEGHVVAIKKPLGSEVKAREAVLYIENRDPGFTYAAVPVRAPISGVIQMLAPTLMSKVARGEKLFAVVNQKSYKLSAEIASSDLVNVKLGATGKFTLDLDQAAKGMPIHISGISPTIDSRTGTAPAELEFDGKLATKDLPPIGSVGHIIFEVKRGQVIQVPENAVVYFENKTYIRVLNQDNTVTKKMIQLGAQKESLYQVLDGLSAGDKIVVRTNRPVKDGESVDVETPKQG